MTARAFVSGLLFSELENDSLMTVFCDHFLGIMVRQIVLAEIAANKIAYSAYTDFSPSILQET